MALRLLAQSAGFACYLFRCTVSNQGVWDAYLLEERFEGKQELCSTIHVPNGNIAKVGSQDLGALEALDGGAKIFHSNVRVSEHRAAETFITQHAVISVIPMVEGGGEY